MKKTISYLYVILGAACWGFIGLFNRMLGEAGVSVWNRVFIRNFISLVLLTVVFALFHRQVFRIRLKHLPIFLGSGLISILLLSVVYFQCQTMCSLSVAAVLLYLAPSFVVLASAVLWKTPLTMGKIAALCVSLLADLFAAHICFMSSLFLGLTVASIPFVALAEKAALRRWQLFPFALAGAALVVALTALRASSGLLTVDMARLQAPDAAYLFLAGAVAITAMVLPGISGSSILLIAGVYLPVIQAIRQFLHLDLQVLPGLLALGFGVIAGAALSIKAIRAALRKHRAAMIWFILGLMLGSLYAIVMGPTSLRTPQPPLDAASFRPLAFLLGAGLLAGLELLHRHMERSAAAA